MNDLPPLPESLWNRLPEDVRPGIEAVIRFKDEEIVRLTAALQTRANASRSTKFETVIQYGQAPGRLTAISSYDVEGNVVWSESDSLPLIKPGEGMDSYLAYLRGEHPSPDDEQEPNDSDEPFRIDP